MHRVLSTLAAAIGLAGSLAAQSYTQLPNGYYARDITPDGSIVVGTANGGGFIWRWRQDPAPTVIPGCTDLCAVSDNLLSPNGLVIAGTRTNPQVNAEEAAVYVGGQFVGGVFTGGSWVGLGWLPNALSCPSRSNSYSISGDGTRVVGLSWNGCSGRGFLSVLTNGVPGPMQELQNLGNGNNRCSAISNNGTTMGGFAQGSFSRTPAYWGDPYGGTNGQAPNLADLGEVYGFKNDGSVAVGTYYFASLNSTRGFTRTKFGGAMTPLPLLTAGWNGNATDISEDGQTIVGYDNLQLGLKAWVWTSADGILSLNTRLANAGIPNVPPLAACLAVSDDGNVVVGGGPFSAGFIVQLKATSPYGTGTPGCAGPEVLDATLPPKIGEANFALYCNNAPALSLGLGLITNAQDYAGSDPFGLNLTLHVDFFTSTETSTYDMLSDAVGLGLSQLPLPNDPGLVGRTYYSQVVWAWSSPLCPAVQPFGLSSSNGLLVRILP